MRTLLAIALAAAVGCAAAQEPPDLEMKTLDGKTLKLSDFRGGKGKVVVLYFQSELCPSALKAEDVKKVADRYAGEDSQVKFIAIFAYHGDDAEGIRKYCEANKIDYPCVFDEDGTVTNFFGAKKVNTTWVLNREGNRVYRGGFTSKTHEWVTEAVKAALEGGEPPASDAPFAG